ncbi:MAG TPA: hypothetical protein VNQ76_19855 [Planctomicrobium sp.]|nr:hypothetical protein [Planctomicrobium sp.]
MAKLTRLTSEDRENLAAYLDGELDEDGTRRIESVLTASEVARNDVDVLARTYEMLDLLPRPQITQDFTERTLASARLREHRKPISQQAWFLTAQRIGVLGLWGIAMLITGMAGYSITNRWIPRQDDVLLKQLPMIQNLDVYAESGSIEFLQELSSQKQLLNDLQRGTSR